MINYIRHDHEFHGVAKLSSGEDKNKVKTFAKETSKKKNPD